MTHAPSKFNWRIFFLLFSAGLLGVLAIFPMMLDLISNQAFRQPSSPDLPVPAIIALALLQNGVLLALVIAAGMKLSARVGSQMPLISAWGPGGTPPRTKPIVLPGLLLGAFTGAALVAIDTFLFVPRLPRELLSFFDTPLWKRLLAGVVYGGITEELLMRLFLMSLLAWLVGKVFKTPQGTPAPAAFWTAIIFVALIFGLGHLPITSAITPLTPLIIARALILNGVAGVAFGYLYWRHGLESAMLGHAAAHIVMQPLGGLLIKSLL